MTLGEIEEVRKLTRVELLDWFFDNVGFAMNINRLESDDRDYVYRQLEKAGKDLIDEYEHFVGE